MHRGRRAHDQLAADELVPALESERNLKRRSLFDAQDQVDARRDALRSDRGQAEPALRNVSAVSDSVVAGLGNDLKISSLTLLGVNL